MAFASTVCRSSGREIFSAWDPPFFPPRDSGEGGPHEVRWAGRRTRRLFCKDNEALSQTPPPPPFGWSPSPASRGRMHAIVLAMRLGIRGLLHASRKPIQSPQIMKGGGAPKGAYAFCRAQRGPARATPTN